MKRLETGGQVLPALSSPGTVGRDDHLSAVIRVSVVHVELEAFPFVRLYQREQVLGLSTQQITKKMNEHHNQLNTCWN